jgi:hypothetical protein
MIDLLLTVLKMVRQSSKFVSLPEIFLHHSLEGLFSPCWNSWKHFENQLRININLSLDRVFYFFTIYVSFYDNTILSWLLQKSHRFWEEIVTPVALFIFVKLVLCSFYFQMNFRITSWFIEKNQLQFSDCVKSLAYLCEYHHLDIWSLPIHEHWIYFSFLRSFNNSFKARQLDSVVECLLRHTRLWIQFPGQ